MPVVTYYRSNNGRLSARPESFDDPRITEQFCRHLEGSAGDLILLGVVHDHPASVARVERVLEAVDPDVLALELPSAALPLYRTYAAGGADESDSPRFGGEMSAAIRASPDVDVVGIDARTGRSFDGW